MRELKVYGYSLSDSVYSIYEINKIISTDSHGQTLPTGDFLTNIAQYENVLHSMYIVNLGKFRFPAVILSYQHTTVFSRA